MMVLGQHSGAGALGAVRGDLAGEGWSRVSDVAPSPTLTDWRRAAEAGAPCPVSSIENALSALGPLADVGWWDETQGLPNGPAFILDLDDRGSAEGGLLLRSESDDRLSGWRPEAGALTVFGQMEMALSPTMPGAARRLAIVGRLQS